MGGGKPQTCISEDDAKIEFGISSQHERMSNGELRFRLTAADGSGYARTVSGQSGGWQNSHIHKNLRETYTVQSGWMALVSLRFGAPEYRRLAAGEIATTEPGIPHNVYLPANAVIHTVKHGIVESTDWIASPDLDRETKPLSENEILERTETRSDKMLPLDPRFGSYVDTYNNLDAIIWRTPAFLAAVILLLIGFMGSNLGQEDVSPTPPVWAMVFFSLGILSLVGSYGMWKVRMHHSWLGAELQRMEQSGYFHIRKTDVNRWFPPPAPHVFIITFVIVGLILVGLGALSIFEYQPLLDALQSSSNSKSPVYH